MRALRCKNANCKIMESNRWTQREVIYKPRYQTSSPVRKHGGTAAWRKWREFSGAENLGNGETNDTTETSSYLQVPYAKCALSLFGPKPARPGHVRGKRKGCRDAQPRETGIFPKWPSAAPLSLSATCIRRNLTAEFKRLTHSWQVWNGISAHQIQNRIFVTACN
jgi:hypothetical protein